MARADHTTGVGPDGPSVHNDGPMAVRVQVLVHGHSVTAETVELAPGETVDVPAAPSDAVEVHADGGTATAPAGTRPAFVVREESVLVAPE